MFPGQGSQKPGMGQDFFNEFPISKAAFDEASQAIGEDMTALCFNEDPRLDLTEFTQPAIVTVEIAMYRALKEKYNLTGAFFAGHSLGEYAALVAADVMPFSDAVKIVRKRGALMQSAVPEGVGAMAAVIMPDIDKSGFEAIVENHGAEVANFNSLEQVVISGKKEAVEAASEEIRVKFESNGVNVIPLNVSAPFHSSMMKGIEDEFRSFISEFSSNFNMDRANTVVSNFTGELHTPETMIDNLISQISGSVKWVQNMRLLKDRSASIYEVGPNRPLQRFFKTVDVDITSIINVRSATKAFG